MAGVPRTKWLWAAVAIVSMWLAVLFVGVFGGEIVNDDAASHQRVPVAAGIAFFAVFGTLVVARHGFRDGPGDGDPSRREINAAERERLRALELELERLRRDVAGLLVADRGDDRPRATVSEGGL